jgi:hypothetical protein
MSEAGDYGLPLVGSQSYALPLRSLQDCANLGSLSRGGSLEADLTTTYVIRAICPSNLVVDAVRSP